MTGRIMRRFLFLAFLILAACTTTQQAGDSLRSGWIGRNADDFVTRYGPPRSQYQLHDGDTLLAWGSTTDVHVPGSTTTTGYINPSTGFYTAQTSGGDFDGSMSCDLQLVVSPDGAVKDIRITRDTWGMFNTSRCAELFR